jgi:hypothetical protein
MTAMMLHMTAMMLIGGLVVLGVLVGLALILLASLRERHARGLISRDEVESGRRNRAA